MSLARRGAIVVTTLFVVASAWGKTVDLKYSHATGRWSCGDENKPCDASFSRGDKIRVTVCDSLPGILEMKASTRVRDETVLDEKSRKRLGLQPSGQALITPTAVGTTPKSPAEIKAAWSTLRTAIDAIVEIVPEPQRYGEYAAANSVASDARQALVDSVASRDVSPQGIVTALQSSLGGEFSSLGMPADELVTWFTNVDRLLRVTEPTCFLASDEFIFSKDADLEITFKSVNPLVTADLEPAADFPILGKNSWEIGSTTGFAISGLADEHWTTRTVTVTPASGDTPAITRKEAVLESKDSYTPEAAIFIHLLPRGENRFPLGVTLGGGLSSGITGRGYLGLTYPFGSAGTFTFGVSGGQVKRLSKNVNRNDLGDVDPEATRRDVLRGSWFFGIAWQVP